MTFSKETRWEKGKFEKNRLVSERAKREMAEYFTAALGINKSREDLLEELSAKYEKSPRQIERYISRRVPSKQDQYAETPHKKRIRELAMTARSYIGLPYVRDIFLIKDSPKGLYPTLDLETSLDYRSLASHLKSGSFSKVLDEIRTWKILRKRYLDACGRLLNKIKAEMTASDIAIAPVGEAKPGLIIDDFSGTLCAAIVGKAVGASTVFEYRVEPHFLVPGLWVLKYGGRGIYLGLDKEGLERHRRMHEDLISIYASKLFISRLSEMNRQLVRMETRIGDKLQKFSSMESLPGKCELCL